MWQGQLMRGLCIPHLLGFRSLGTPQKDPLSVWGPPFRILSQRQALNFISPKNILLCVLVFAASAVHIEQLWCCIKKSATSEPKELCSLQFNQACILFLRGSTASIAVMERAPTQSSFQTSIQDTPLQGRRAGVRTSWYREAFGLGSPTSWERASFFTSGSVIFF